jgi:two-component system, cell cycle response regulator DivK
MRLELERQGFIVLEAEDGRSAVDVAAKEIPDVILMDLTLPHMDGLSAAKLIRKKSGKLETIPIIAVTAHQETDFRTGAKASGFDAYVTKPIDINSLKELSDGLLI